MLTDADMIKRDIEARESALDVSRSFIVQAPAGSGKTELLIQRYLRLLTIVDQPEEILAITFTNKAAREMQNRVIQALRNAREGVVAETSHERLTLASAKNVLARDVASDWRLIDSPGRMRIQTVDAFGAGVARSLPLSSGLGGTSLTLADAGMDQIYRDAAAATLDYLAADDGPGRAVELVLVHLDNNVSLYVEYVARMLASREKWLAITGAGLDKRFDASATRRELEENIRDIVDGQLRALHDSLPQAAQFELLSLLNIAASNLLADGKPDHPLAQFAGRTAMPEPAAENRDAWQAIAGLLLIQSGAWRKSVNKNDGFPPAMKEEKQRLYELIGTLREQQALQDHLGRAKLLPAAEYPQAQWDVLVALFNLLPLAASELRRLFGERGVTDHNEVALSAGRALGDAENPGDIAMILDYKVQHLLVDEMQDTSISQYELLKQLTSGWTPGDGRTIFCVGDPMQSIYRFRDAEVGEFLQARQNGIGDIRLEPLVLRQNFRSGENLVHWFNTIFSQVMPLHDDITIGAIAYAESAAVEQHAGAGRCFVHPLFDSDAEASCTLDVIRQCLGDDGDVTVLVRSRTQLAELLPALRRASIPYQAIEIDRLTDLPEIIDALALTRALVHPGDRLAWLSVLRGPWVGLSWSDLHSLVRNDADSTVPELCADTSRVSLLSPEGAGRLQHFVEIVTPFMQRKGTLSLRDRVELAWFALGGPAILADEAQVENVYRYFTAVEKLERAGSLEDVRQLEQRLDDERVSAPISSQCRLQIMTMHKAKGLQFDHVILPGLGRATRRSDRDVLRWLTVPGDSGRNRMIISPVGARSELENDPLYRFIEATENDKDRMEQDRLLYVACTRAVRSLHLVGHVAATQNGTSFGAPISGSLLARLWPAIQGDFERAFQPTQDEAADAETDSESYLVNPVLRRFRQPWQAPAPRNLPLSQRSAIEDPVIAEQEVEFYWVGTAARHAGTLVHRWLQRMSDGRSPPNIDELASLRPVTIQWARDLGVSDQEIEEVCERTSKAIRGLLSHEKGRWLIEGEGYAELPLTGVINGRIESVVIDRVRIDEHGTHWIVDYKTSTHEGGNLEGFLEQESARYRQQLANYASLYAGLTGEPVRTALYFPLLQEFCEVTI